MVACLIDTTSPPSPVFSSVAAAMTAQQRQDLAVAMLARQQPVKTLAAETGVSRRFCYEQEAKAQNALEDAFAPDPDDLEVLYHLPVTKAWVRQFVLGVTLVGHSSDRAVVELADCLLGYSKLSVGTVHNIMMQAAATAAALNAGEDLSAIRVGALDEIYQANRPVLAGVDVVSTYCFLLSLEDHCDGTTWGVRMLELSEGRKLDLDRSIAGGGKGLRAGQKEAWPAVPCLGDVFHPLRDMEDLAGFLNRRAEAARGTREDLEHKRQACREQGKAALGQRWGMAKREEAKAAGLAADVALLTRWMREDVLAVAGEPLEGRQALYDFIVAELEARESLCPHRLTPLRRSLAGQRDQLLGFAAVLEEELGDVAQRLNVPAYLVQAMVRLEALDKNQCLHWQRRAELTRNLGESFGAVEASVKAVLADTHRASSLVENLNGRLRGYFFLRRQLSQPYLDLLRFYLNHHRFARSQRPERVGKSPLELLSGQEHPHWLEMLGYSLFHRN